MFGARGNRVLTLKRISFGGLLLPDDLKEGESRELTKEELALVFVKND
jgi:16S rRNA U516 pseudouridylate synthase RsuA-like enzyme